jgi:hypothetical protein
MAVSKLVHQAKAVASLVSLITVASSLVASPAVRHVLRSLFSPTSHPVRFGALVVALYLNVKSIPFAWHWRFFKGFMFQTYLRSTPLPRDALFRPLVTTSMFTPTNDTDFNGHKSNSTYFADLDVARTQHVACLLSHGIRKSHARTHPELQLKGDLAVEVDVAQEKSGPAQQKQSKPRPAVFAIALGGVSCNFKREIKPYEPFDIWTRVLSWDHKWIYQVSHMVKAGTVPPDYYALQPWRTPLNKAQDPVAGDFSEEQKAQFKAAIFATSISKYVVKRGRQTVPPELVLNSSNLLPPKTGEPPNENSKKPISGKSLPDAWTWEGVEAERARGMEIAEHFAALDQLQEEFPVGGFGSNNGLEILGEYSDF